MKLEPNMYVRTNKGIAKIVEIFDKENEPYYGVKYRTDTFLEIYYDSEYIGDEDISKSSHNIIDLIEFGDYVNGIQVIDKEIDNLNEKYLQCGVGDYVICTYYSNEIEDVVTKEQFSQIAYKVGLNL